MRTYRTFFLPVLVPLFALTVLSGCAQVPKESIELSTTVGRDTTIVYKSHRDLAKLLFARMRQDVNRFGDDVYAPYQTRAAMENDLKNSRSSDAADRSASLLLAIHSAFQPESSEKLQRQVSDSMAFMLSSIRDDVEAKRQELLKPLGDQETQVLDAIDQNYAQIIYANSIVTGHLASVAKVHDAQNDLLGAIGLDPQAPDVIGKKLAATSDHIASLVQKSEKVEANVTTINAAFADLKKTVGGN